LDKHQLITLAAKSKMLQNLARKLCNYRYIGDDLFQEFLLYLLNKDEEFLVRKYLEVQFIFYCSNVIKGLNINRITSSKYLNTKNTLCEKIHNCELSGFEFTDNNYNFEIDEKYNEIIKDEQAVYLTNSYGQLIEQTGQTYSKIHNLKTKAKNELKKKYAIRS